TASLGYTDPSAADMLTNGTLTFSTSGSSPVSASPSPAPAPTPASAPASTPASSSTGTITLHVSGDHWSGATNGKPDPQFIVLADGHQIGGTQTVTAVHDAGQWQDITVSGSFGAPNEVDVQFVDDSSGGTHATDVN